MHAAAEAIAARILQGQQKKWSSEASEGQGSGARERERKGGEKERGHGRDRDREEGEGGARHQLDNKQTKHKIKKNRQKSSKN